MHVLDLSYESPACNLAIDEVLLDNLEKGTIPEILRFWESPSRFIVLGHGGKMSREVDLHEANRLNIPILRRVSGGGTVMQGRGCLNYSVIKRSEEDLYSTISSTTCNVMKKCRDALNTELTGVSIKGVSDLVYEGKKISGNAQKRKKRSFLFHGTFLYNFEISDLEGVLTLPDRQPDYRCNKSHNDFVQNISVSKTKLMTLMKKEWDAHTEFEMSDFLTNEINNLAISKYESKDWVYKFK
ncbi:lipoate--protein ligase family protein [bacterium]|jgi:lipoate---protein ligase|nr:lipoate--protein ligase family protein [bacterium]